MAPGFPTPPCLVPVRLAVRLAPIRPLSPKWIGGRRTTFEQVSEMTMDGGLRRTKVSTRKALGPTLSPMVHKQETVTYGTPLGKSYVQGER